MAADTPLARSESAVDPAFRADVLRGFAMSGQRAIPARWLYDRAGSELFEEITRLPEYYPTRTETALLAATSAEIARHVAPGAVVVEFGSGASTKTPLLLRAIAPAGYIPIDISAAFLRESADALAADFPDIRIEPITGDFTRPIILPDWTAAHPRLGFFPGSTIGNLAPEAAVDLLRTMRASLGEGALLLIGFDRAKPESVLLPAYDDAQGVTARFDLNLLARINRELQGTIPLDAFRHKVVWNDFDSRVEMHLEAQRDITFRIAGQDFAMHAGETIHSENSHKYGARDSRMLLRAGGWSPLYEWSDARDFFTLVLARARARPLAP
ncbi:L-histidine N(alpha)-methyltransferase [Sphingomonas sp. C3-2]|uniref:L-histidine N(alpha)-methyltransferase n=1 Tax=Sphingomonas sp. C3-2 TaxID=3062169 RepID=UPI00294B4631|nr:L-histidine N(alpha)-methyltransferase [Sphingomonas sp. C3-2]WOK35234.1 L-histidine N(alpha)-methyltransferase [Sphingomonas sp. C3-2]